MSAGSGHPEWRGEVEASSDSTITWTGVPCVGAVAGWVELDPRFRPIKTGSDYVLRAWTSGLRVESVRRYGLEKP